MADNTIRRLLELTQMTNAELRAVWGALFGKQPPQHMSKSLMLPILSYGIQVQAYGGLSASASRRLRQIAHALEADPDTPLSLAPRVKPGTRLLREWRGETHTVTVEDDGYEYKGACYSSLSEIARLITGTRWSGPLFFGLKIKENNVNKAERTP